MKIIVGLSGASGVIYGIRLLESLRELEVETHLVISPSAEKTIVTETKFTVEQIRALAHKNHDYRNIGAAISSGSFITEGMVVVPCSIKTLSGIANSYNDNLLVRAADVCLKEKRRLILVVRETPLHLGHLRLMADICETGGTILPPVPAFYHLPQTLDDIVNQTVGKILDQFRLKNNLFERWSDKPRAVI